jgi:subtilase family serine protease
MKGARRTGAAAILLAVLTLAAGAQGAGQGKDPGAPETSILALFYLHHPGGLYRFTRAVSDPSSPRYRHYRSVEHLIRRFGATKKAIQATKRWLIARGAEPQVGATRTWITARIPRRSAAPLLRESAGRPALPGPRPVPAGLRGEVDQVAVLDQRSLVQRLPIHHPEGPFQTGQSSSAVRSGTPKGCADGINAGKAIPPETPGFTPNQYLTAYGHSQLHKRGLRGAGQRVAVVEVDGFKRSDIETFGRCFGRKVPPLRVAPIGTSKPLAPGAETTLDLEMLTASAPKLRGIDVYEGGGTPAELMYTMGSALGRRGHHPDVISISLGICEPKLRGSIAQVRAVNNIFAVAGASGISVFVAAGDTGSAGCRVDTADGTTALPQLAVDWPGSSPFVTVVGGTNLVLDKANRIRNEVVWNDTPGFMGGGGGGTSIFTHHRPWWQLGRGLSGQGPGRKVPDIVALADPAPGFALFCTAPGLLGGCVSPTRLPNGGWQTIGGTSAASPLTAGGVALVDQDAARHGQRPLGFLNPLLYLAGTRGKNGAGAFRDVKQGDNDTGVLTPADAGGGQPLGCCPARRGYDMASGWGSLKLPGFDKLARRAAK